MSGKSKASDLTLPNYKINRSAEQWCHQFLKAKSNRYVFGCNDWAKSIADCIDLTGFIDDFVSFSTFHGKPVIRSSEIPANARVVSAIVGERPRTAINHLNSLNVSCLDYFAFKKYSGLELKNINFIDGFELEFFKHEEIYRSIFRALKDSESKLTFQKIINFRLTQDLKFLNEYENRQYQQYFERFLNLNRENEVFLDVGSYDGFTSEEFISRCPEYREVHVFEPEPSNMIRVKQRLGNQRSIIFHPYGASNVDQEVYIQSAGSSSRLSLTGGAVISVKRIDNVIDTPYSFLKMDIEGGERNALDGAKQSIAAYRPRVAVSVYHRPSDLREIYQEVTSCVANYSVHLRHYTEGVTETVMFFLPQDT